MSRGMNAITRERLSPSEIRDKLQARAQKKSVNEPKQEQQTSQSEATKVSVKKNVNLDKMPEGIEGDIKPNDPSDPITHEKLKALLNSGGFGFNPAERKALSSILNK